MVNLLKTFGKGILYVIGLPFFLVALVLFGAAGLIAFIVQLFMSIIYFFSGQKFFPDLPEDLELRALKEGIRDDDEEEDEEEEPIAQPINQNKEQPKFVYPFIEEEPTPEEPMKEEPINQDIPHEDSFEIKKEEVEEEEIVEEKPNPFFFNDTPSKEDTIETTNIKEEAEEEEEILETYVPRSSSFSVDDDDTEEENGVDIKYDL